MAKFKFDDTVYTYEYGMGVVTGIAYERTPYQEVKVKYKVKFMKSHKEQWISEDICIMV